MHSKYFDFLFENQSPSKSTEVQTSKIERGKLDYIIKRSMVVLTDDFTRRLNLVAESFKYMQPVAWCWDSIQIWYHFFLIFNLSKLFSCHHSCLQQIKIRCLYYSNNVCLPGTLQPRLFIGNLHITKSSDRY